MSLPNQKLFRTFSVVCHGPVGSYTTSGVPQPKIPLCFISRLVSFQAFPSRHEPVKTLCSRPPKARSSDALESKKDVVIDVLLLRAEAICLFSSVVLVIGHALNSTFSEARKTWLGAIMGNHSVFAWGVAALAGAVAAGAWIRRRQATVSLDLEAGEEMNLARRVSLLEEELKNSVTVIRVLSRQLEKLGIRFRVTRKVLKGPLAETAALAQKNSDVTQALALQEEILEKELGEMQRVLLAMQEQQQKQLELILTIASGNSSLQEQEEEKQQADSVQSSFNEVEQLEAALRQASDKSG